MVGGHFPLGSALGPMVMNEAVRDEVPRRGIERGRDWHWNWQRDRHPGLGAGPALGPYAGEAWPYRKRRSSRTPTVPVV
jgi:hypothetical protein